MYYKMNFNSLNNLADLDDWITINLALAESYLNIPVKRPQPHYEQLEEKGGVISDGVINRLVNRGQPGAGDQWTKMREDYKLGKLTGDRLAETYLEIKEAKEK